MAAKGKTLFRWTTWLTSLLLLLITVVAPGIASGAPANAWGTRTWEKTFAAGESRQAESPQVLILHQERTADGDNDAPGYVFAAEQATARPRGFPVEPPMANRASVGMTSYEGMMDNLKAFADRNATRSVRAGDVTTFRDFVDRSVIGDNLEGHELWQHANLKARGLATERLSTTVSQDNPVIVMSRSVHQEVTKAQMALDGASMAPLHNIDANATLVRLLDAAPESAVSQAQAMTRRHAISLGFQE